MGAEPDRALSWSMPSPQSLVLRFADLRVLRVVPSGDASPITAVTVTFDRPVAGSLDRTVDPGAVFAITPAVAGAVDWRGRLARSRHPSLPPRRRQLAVLTPEEQRALGNLCRKLGTVS
jgi:hypothetical protein